MHIYFSGIGGTGIGPLALIAHQAGFEVSGSDKQNSNYIDYLKKHGIDNIKVGENLDHIDRLHKQNPIDWYVYSSALEREPAGQAELSLVKTLGLHVSKRDEFLNMLLKKTGQKMIAVAGTHGKTTTTAMTIWLMKQLGLPVSYSVGAKISFGEMGEYDKDAKYFVYEADEFDRNFLSYHPAISIISGIAYDHPDIYPTKKDYDAAFRQFIGQSELVYAHQNDIEPLNEISDHIVCAADDFSLPGLVNRQNAQLVVSAVQPFSGHSTDELIEIMNRFPGVSRRFEKLRKNLYSDYAHTPEKILGAINIAHESKNPEQNLIVVYEGLHNTRQHFIKDHLMNLFESTNSLIVVPSYLAREDENLELLTPQKLATDIIKLPEDKKASNLDAQLQQIIQLHLENGDLVLALSAGGGGSLDEWIRREFSS